MLFKLQNLSLLQTNYCTTPYILFLIMMLIATVFDFILERENSACLLRRVFSAISSSIPDAHLHIQKLSQTKSDSHPLEQAPAGECNHHHIFLPQIRQPPFVVKWLAHITVKMEYLCTGWISWYRVMRSAIWPKDVVITR